MISIHDLHAIAHELGVTLQHHDGGKIAWYSPSMKRISTQRGLQIWDYKSALAHELGHAIHGDRFINHSHFNNRQERRADEYAARLLVDHEEFLDSLRWNEGDLGAVAAELEVTPQLLETYIDIQEKENVA